MRDSTKKISGTIALVLGVILTGIGCFLLADGLTPSKSFSDPDMTPFDFPVALNGTQTSAEFTAAKTDTYEVHLEMQLPKDEAANIGLYWCLLRPTNSEPRSDCPTVKGDFDTEWSTADAADKKWDDWSSHYDWGYAIINGGAGNRLGFVSVQEGHRYIVKFRAKAGYRKLWTAKAHLRANIADKAAQMNAAFGNLFSGIAILASVPFLVIGIPLLVTGILLRRNTRSAKQSPGKRDQAPIMR